jgi:hypothetical protein
MERGDCGCRNHKGTRKVKWPSRDQAMYEASRRSRKGGTWSVYPCPNKAGAWHITNQPAR